MPATMRPFLMFEGKAEEAMNLYVSLFADGEVLHVERWAAGEPGKQGEFKLAKFRVAGQDVTCFDSPAPHAFTFTPSVSFFVDCETEAEQTRIYDALKQGGGELMPIGDYGFSRRFGWVNDRFGVSWQINLP